MDRTFLFRLFLSLRFFFFSEHCSLSCFLARFLSSCQMSILAISSSPSVSHFLHFTFTVHFQWLVFFLSWHLPLVHASELLPSHLPPHRCFEGMNTNRCLYILPLSETHWLICFLSGDCRQDVLCNFGFQKAHSLCLCSPRARFFQLKPFPQFPFVISWLWSTTKVLYLLTKWFLVRLQHNPQSRRDVSNFGYE